jgi:hypothetical protein
MRILILVLSSNKPPYDQFMQTQKSTWDSIEHPQIITRYFHGGETGGDKEFALNCSDDFYMMHWKHKLAIDRALELDWDICFRINSSSYVDKSALHEFCKSLPITNLYGGWLLGDTLPYIEWEGQNIKQHCISGAGIFYSRDIARIISDSMTDKEDIEEDVLIGRTLYLKGIPVTFDDKSRCDFNGSLAGFRPAYHYRIKSGDRQKDIKLMRKLHKRITG